MGASVVVGATITLPCRGCRRSITWTVPETKWWNYIPQYHSKSCRNRHSRRLNTAEVVFSCPHPFKRNYSRFEEAHEEAVRQAVNRLMLYSAYRCRCGGWHVGHREFRINRDDAQRHTQKSIAASR